MTAELAVPDRQPTGGEVARPADAPVSGLVAWAMGARQAHQIAQSLARTPFVPASLVADPRKMSAPTEEERRALAWDTTVGNVTAAILTGEEIGLQPMTALRSIDLIQGTPGMRAHAMRALVVSKGHDLVLADSTDQRCIYRGRRRLATLNTGEPVWGDWQVVEWTIDRARKLGITGRDQWQKQPRTMLIARATGEICRLVAPDVLHGVQYVSEELDQVAGGPPVTAGEMQGRRPVTAADIEAQAGDQPQQGDAPVTRSRLNALFGELRRLGYGGEPSRPARLAVLSALADRPLGSSSDLTTAEARVAHDTLSALNPDTDRATLDQLEQAGRELLVQPAADEPAADPEGHTDA